MRVGGLKQADPAKIQCKGNLLNLTFTYYKCYIFEKNDYAKLELF